MAMARGLPVVTTQWVLESVVAGKWLQFEGYLALDAHPQAPYALQGKLFYVKATECVSWPQSLDLWVHPFAFPVAASCLPSGARRLETPFPRSSIGRHDLEQLIHAAGGAVVPRRAATHVVDTASANALEAGGGAEEESEQPKERVDDKWIFNAVMGPQGEDDEEAEDEEDSEEF